MQRSALLNRSFRHRFTAVTLLLSGFGLVATANAGNIAVTSAGAPTSSTCTLAQAIGRANANNGVTAASIGSAATNLGNCVSSGVPPNQPGPNTIVVGVSTITLSGIDNYWYGPNALPPIASDITIVAGATNGVTKLLAAHVGDPTPATAKAFRFFYVSGGFPGELPLGSLTLRGVILQNGYAKGGDSLSGGGGAGMGGAIFNQGLLTLDAVALIGNTAQGGALNVAGLGNAGAGMGQDAGVQGISGSNGGGFGGTLGLGYGGKGSLYSLSNNPNIVPSGNGSGAGGGFLSSSDGGAIGFARDGTTLTRSNGAFGGGLGGLGGAGGGDGGGVGGDGGGGGGGGVDYNHVPGGDGGNFGSGGTAGTYGGGGGGVGGGGAWTKLNENPGGGGFGGGRGWCFGCGGGAPSAGFGGGGGGGGSTNVGGGFGGGRAGAGMGGAIFNHTGTVVLHNVTATGNTASSTLNSGSGLGAAIFNLNGAVTVEFSTLAGNFLRNSNGRPNNSGPEDATVYSLAYGNNLLDGSLSMASLTLRNSIIRGTHADGGSGNDVLVNVVDGAHTNAASVVYAGKNIVPFSTKLGNVTQTGSAPLTADPLLGPLQVYGDSAVAMPTLAIGANSPATNAASDCLESDGVTALSTDGRGAPRPFAGSCDIGAVEYQGDYIFANGFESSL